MNIKISFVPFMGVWLITWGDPQYPNFLAIKDIDKHKIPATVARILSVKEDS